LDSKIKDSNVNGFWNGKGYIDFKNSAVKTGWQIYNEPNPQFLAGDWVELTDGLQCCLTECLNPNSGHWLAKKVDGSEVSAWEKDSIRTIARTIQKSEVVVTLTLSGTVSEFDDDGDFELRFGDSKNDYHVININALTPEDAELVRELMGGGE